jgi:hypothetical protein
MTLESKYHAELSHDVIHPIIKVAFIFNGFFLIFFSNFFLVFLFFFFFQTKGLFLFQRKEIIIAVIKQ